MNKHVIKLYARLIQKGTYTKEELPEDIRDAVMEMAATLPLRKDMIKEKTDVEINE